MGSCPSGDLSKWGVDLVGSCPSGELFQWDRVVLMGSCSSGELFKWGSSCPSDELTK